MILIDTKNHCSNGLNFFMLMTFLIAQQILPSFISYLSKYVLSVEPLVRVNHRGQGKCPLIEVSQRRGSTVPTFYQSVRTPCGFTDFVVNDQRNYKYFGSIPVSGLM